MFCLFVLSQIGPVLGANILGVFPYPAKSHFTMFQALLDQLHGRGHNLTVLSHFPRETKVDNYTDVSLVGSMRSLHSNVSLSLDAPLSLHENLWQLYEDIDVYDGLLSDGRVQSFLNSNSRFDLVITEIFNTDLFLGFVHRFRAPYIAMSPCPLMPWAYSRVGVSKIQSHIPVIFTAFHDHMSFGERFKNFFYALTSNLFYKYVINPKSELIARKHFGDMPPLEVIADEVSLVLVNTYPTLHKPAILSSKLIQVGGLHVTKPHQLSPELAQFIDESEAGVILFSLGSMFRAETLPPRARDAFFNAFKKVPERVIWKGEPVGNASNIKYVKWIPQRDILGHEKIKLFIYHGGLLGMTEAVHCGVPVLGVPMYGDMPLNVAAVVAARAGLALSFRNISEESIYAGITEIIENPEYKRNAVQLSRKFRDRPQPALDTAVYWTEYVIRHRGNPQISSTNELSWLEMNSLDIAIVIITSIFVFKFFIIISVRLYLDFRQKDNSKVKFT